MANGQLNLKTRPQFLLIDANGLMHRAYYALPPLTDKQGKVVNALYGFFACLFKILREQNFQYVVAAFDSPGETFRHRQYSLYKANRVKAPDEFYAQFPQAKKILRLLHIPVVEKSGYEADDLIGSLAQRFQKAGVKIFILTGDFDLLQLVNSQVNVVLLKKGVSQTVSYNVSKAREKLGGLNPEKIIDLKSLAGDSSDNIPGVPGIGPKTALSLLRKFGSLENIYAQIEKSTAKISSSLQEKLQKYKNQAFLSKNLAMIKTDIKLDLPLEKCSWKSYNKKEVEALFSKLGFKSLLSRLP